MKKNKMVFVILLLFLIVLLVILSLNFILKDKTSSDDTELTSKEKEELVEDITNDINEDYYTGEDETENDKSDEKDDNDDSNKKYDQYFVASGYSGASDNVYYTKDGVLYHLILSTNEIIKIAEGVSKIENGRGTIEVYKGDNFKIIEEDNYLTYID